MSRSALDSPDDPETHPASVLTFAKVEAQQQSLFDGPYE